MTFETLPDWQAWALVAAAAGLALLLFNLKVRPPRHRLPSLLIWHRVLAEPRALTWWERLRRTVSRVVTVAIAAIVTGSALEPSPDSATGASRTRIVVDAAWSMAARLPEGGTRWDRAVARAGALARRAPHEIVLATTADGIVEGPTRDPEVIERALARLTPGGGADAPWPAATDGEEVHLVTDGATPRLLPSSLVVHQVGGPVSNVAITALEVRPALPTNQEAAAYLEVANFSPRSQTVQLTITRDADTVTDRWIDLTAGEIRAEHVTLVPDGGPRLRAHVAATENALTIDDEAFAWIADADEIDVVLVTGRPEAIAPVLDRDPHVRLRTLAPNEYGAALDARVDVIVFDEWVPPRAPDRPALLLAPSAGAPWLAESGTTGVDPRQPANRDHAVVTGVDPVMLGVTRAAGPEVVGLTVLADPADNRPLVVVDDRPNRRLVLLGFEADEAVRGAPVFPVLVGNAIAWLAGPDLGGSARPGAVAFPASTTGVTGPDGAAVPLVRTSSAVIGVADQPGLYRATVGGAEAVLAVNAMDRDLSNLLHAETDAADVRQPGVPLAGRPWWMTGLLVVFLLLVIEWWTWQRRITV